MVIKNLLIGFCMEDTGWVRIGLHAVCLMGMAVCPMVR